MSQEKLQKWHLGFVLLILISVVIRLWVMSASLQLREHTDVTRYKDWARIAYLYGFADSYLPTHLTFGNMPNNQPPGTLYVLDGAYTAQLRAANIYMKFTHQKPGTNLFINGPLVNIFLRIPSLLADIVIGLLLYVLIGRLKGNRTWQLIGSGLFLLNPVVIYNSAFWGQMDSVNNVFFILALLLLTYKKYFVTVLVFFLGLFIKFSLVIFLPFLLLFIYQQGISWRRLLWYPLIAWIMLCSFSLPVTSNAFVWLTSFLQTASGEMQNVTVYAFNFWWMLFHPHMYSSVSAVQNLYQFSSVNLTGVPLVTAPLLGTTLLTWSLVPVCLLLGLLFERMWHAKPTLTQSMFISAVVALMVFLFLPRMHERYMYPMFAPLALYIGIKKQFLLEFIILSVANMLNLYMVWHPFALSWFPLGLINSQVFQWVIATVSVMVGLWLYMRVLQMLRSTS